MIIICDTLVVFYFKLATLSAVLKSKAERSERLTSEFAFESFLALPSNDHIVFCFLKPLNSACFLSGMMDWVANRLYLRPAAELLGGWPEIQPVCISINAVPALKGLRCTEDRVLFYNSQKGSNQHILFISWKIYDYIHPFTVPPPWGSLVCIAMWTNIILCVGKLSD